MKLLTRNNPKLVKGEALGYMSFVLHLAPARLSGYNTCAGASVGCTNACLNISGHAGIFRKGETTNAIQRARIRKTLEFFNNREAFMYQLMRDIYSAIAYAKRKGMIPTFRLNGTSDIRWETIPVSGYRSLMHMFPQYMFYDYTKLNNRHDLPANYHLTFSRSETNEAQALEWLANERNVAVVFRDALPQTWNGYYVIDGTETDLRFLDSRGVVVGLLAKGKGKRDRSGFVVDA
jgi:hypothetical protein